MMINVHPFNEFWIDCRFNSCFSILTSINKSYCDASYMNCYSYITYIEKTPFTSVKCLRLRNSDRSQSDLIDLNITTIPVEFRNQSNMVKRVIELLQYNHLLIGVDLYYWIPNSICWYKNHWEHYAFVKKYDKDKNAFIVLDENLNGYGEHEIPCQRFETAVLGSPLPGDGFIIKYKNDLEDYKINCNEVFSNADRLIKELRELSDLPSDYWILSKPDIEKGNMFDLLTLHTFQIANRHIANIKLISRLKDLEFINNEKYGAMADKFDELRKGWTIIKNKIIKGNVSVPRNLDSRYLNIMKDNLLMKEISVWENLLA